MKIGTVNAGFASKGVRLGNYEFNENRYSKRRAWSQGVRLGNYEFHENRYSKGRAASEGVRLGNYEFHENRYSKRRVAGKGVKEILPEFSTFLMRSVNNPEQ